MSSFYILTMPRGFDRERTNVHKLQYHFIWCPKYRKSVLTDEVADRLEQLIEEKADELLEEMEAADEETAPVEETVEGPDEDAGSSANETGATMPSDAGADEEDVEDVGADAEAEEADEGEADDADADADADEEVEE